MNCGAVKARNYQYVEPGVEVPIARRGQAGRKGRYHVLPQAGNRALLCSDQAAPLGVGAGGGGGYVHVEINPPFLGVLMQCIAYIYSNI